MRDWDTVRTPIGRVRRHDLLEQDLRRIRDDETRRHEAVQRAGRLPNPSEKPWAAANRARAKRKNELADRATALKANGMTNEQIAEAIDRTPRWVRELLKSR